MKVQRIQAIENLIHEKGTVLASTIYANNSMFPKIPFAETLPNFSKKTPSKKSMVASFLFIIIPKKFDRSKIVIQKITQKNSLSEKRRLILLKKMI